MTAAELYEIVNGTEGVWSPSMWYTTALAGPRWNTLVEVGHAHREYATLHPDRAHAMLLGFMVAWLGERNYYKGVNNMPYGVVSPIRYHLTASITPHEVRTEPGRKPGEKETKP